MLFKKILILLLSLWCVITGTFILMHSIPGDPFIGEQNIPPEILKSLYSHYGLDQPYLVQYGKYLLGILQGDLGTSIIYQGRKVTDFIRDGFPISAQLGAQALLVAIPFGIFIGTIASLKKNRWQDKTAMLISTLGISVPNFVMASLLQWLISMKLHLLPVARMESFAHTILPTIALSALPSAFIARLVRTNMVEVLQQDYIKTALSKGLPLFLVSIRHGLKNALLPTIAYLGPVTSQILTGSFMIERIFAIPGLGQWMIYSIAARDYPMIVGLTIFFSSFLMISIFLSDVLYSMIDPRIHIQKRKYA
ncbi:MAG TPA: ABC transporter permease [Chlamydiales bacterium]|nr:ABC transporter permease [Chlamydiales bacterium]